MSSCRYRLARSCPSARDRARSLPVRSIRPEITDHKRVRYKAERGVMSEGRSWPTWAGYLEPFVRRAYAALHHQITPPNVSTAPAMPVSCKYHSGLSYASTISPQPIAKANKAMIDFRASFNGCYPRGVSAIARFSGAALKTAIGRVRRYMLLRYCPPTSNNAFVICPSEHTRTASISTANTFPLLITVC